MNEGDASFHLYQRASYMGEYKTLEQALSAVERLRLKFPADPFTIEKDVMVITTVASWSFGPEQQEPKEVTPMKIKVNDFVRLLDYKQSSIDSHARVTEVTETGVYVTNMNMPFQGSIAHRFFKFDRVKLYRNLGV